MIHSFIQQICMKHFPCARMARIKTNKTSTQYLTPSQSLHSSGEACNNKINKEKINYSDDTCHEEKKNVGVEERCNYCE